ncbi:7578_t:CDS:1, partial [Dentiscutata erythropus]
PANNPTLTTINPIAIPMYRVFKIVLGGNVTFESGVRGVHKETHLYELFEMLRMFIAEE